MKVGKWRDFFAKWQRFVFEDFRHLGLMDMLIRLWVSMGLMLRPDEGRSKGLLRMVAIEERAEIVGRSQKMQIPSPESEGESVERIAVVGGKCFLGYVTGVVRLGWNSFMRENFKNISLFYSISNKGHKEITPLLVSLLLL